MSKLPVIKGRELAKFIKSIGFRVTRTKGSHVRLRSEDGRVTTVPVHGNKDIPKGLLRKIIREDLELNLEDFLELYYYHGKKKDTAYRWFNIHHIITYQLDTGCRAYSR